MIAPRNTQILGISIKNFRSFCSKQEISFSDDGTSMRKITAMIGLNATGKSNVALALKALKHMVRLSANADFRLPYEPFLYKMGMDGLPTSFILKFTSNNTLYQYAVQFDCKTIVSEKLTEKTMGAIRSKTIFERIGSNVNAGAVNFGFGKSIISRTRSNTLLVTKAFENNNLYANIVRSAVESYYTLFGGDGKLEGMAASLLKKDPSLKRDVIKALHNADFSIRDLRVDDIHIPEEILDKLNMPDEVRENVRKNGGIALNAGHYLKNEIGDIVMSGKDTPVFIGSGISNESTGTRAFLGAIVPILDSIKKGKTLYIDEFGTYLHYNLVVKIIESYKYHKNAPGLIINTHAGMALDCLDRNSIVLLSKDSKTEETHVSTLIDEKARNKESFSNGFYSDRYEALRYGPQLLF